MDSSIKIALIAAATVLGATVIVTGRYTAVAPSQGFFFYEVDRFTGQARICSASGCHDIPGNQPTPDPWAPAPQ